MYEKYMYPKKLSIRRSIQNVALCTAALLLAIRFFLAPPPVRNRLDGAVMVLFGIGAFVSGDRWGFTESRNPAVRAVGWIIVLVLAAAFVVGGYREFTGK